MGQRIFISYHPLDAAFAEDLIRQAQQQGFTVSSHAGHRPRARLRSAVQREIEHCEVFVVVLSPDALRARAMEDACRLAITHPTLAHAIVPVIARNVARGELWPFLAERLPMLATGADPLPGETVAAATQRLLAQAQLAHLPPTRTRASAAPAAELRANADALPQTPVPSATRPTFATDESSHPHIYLCFQTNETLAAEKVFENLHRSYANAAIIRDQSRRVSEADFQSYVLDQLIDQSEIFVVLIGPDSLNHINDPNDRFRRQLAFALKAPHVKVIPLLNGVRLQKKHLPPDLHDLADLKVERHAIDMTKDTGYMQTMRRLNDIIRKGTISTNEVVKNLIITLIVAAIIGVGGSIWYFVSQRVFPPQPQFTIHTSASVIEAANATQPLTAVANCPSGATALSGGYIITDPANPTGDYYPQASYPTTTTSSGGVTTSGWTVSYMNDSTDEQTFQATVVCVANVTPTVQIQSAAVGMDGQGTATCPSGMQAIGGGFNFNDPTITVSVSAPLHPQQGVAPTAWAVQTFGAQTGDQQIVYAVCVSGLRHIILGAPSTISLDVDTSATVQSSCASGTLVSAGYILRNVDGVGNVYIIRTAPLPSDSAWQLLLKNIDGANQGGALWPICAG
jgi:hypothetical protein